MNTELRTPLISIDFHALYVSVNARAYAPIPGFDPYYPFYQYQLHLRHCRILYCKTAQSILVTQKTRMTSQTHLDNTSSTLEWIPKHIHTRFRYKQQDSIPYDSSEKTWSPRSCRRYRHLAMNGGVRLFSCTTEKAHWQP